MLFVWGFERGSFSLPRMLVEEGEKKKKMTL